jgi:glycosyltransferase involved in cell wall biosynthesis
LSVEFRYRFIVLWQSLVVASYRSFFAHLLRLTGAPVTLIAPDAFRELGGQMTRCAEFTAPFSHTTDLDPGRSYILRCFSPHVQIALFAGLRKVLRRFLAGSGNKAADAPERPVFLCIAEPYSVTAFVAWIVMRTITAPGPRCLFVTYSAQNIFKQLPLPLLMIQKFLFHRSDAILVCGHGQEPVLRRHGYQGPVIYFPLWFDSARFFPRSREDAEAALKNSGLHLPAPAMGERAVRFGYCGSLAAEKGVPDLLQMFGSGRLPPHLELWVAGDGPLRDEVRNAGSPVLSLGRLTPDQISAFMCAVDILIVPSRTTAYWKEQFGRVIVEAMACGTIVLGSDSGEIPFVIDDPDRIFREGDSGHLRNRLLHWATVVAGTGGASERDKSIRRSRAYTDEACAVRFQAALADSLRSGHRKPDPGASESGEILQAPP